MKSALISLLIIFFSFSIFNLYEKSKAPPISDENEGISALKLDKNMINILAIGQQRLLSSFFWIETMLNANHFKHEDKNTMSPLYYKYKTISDLDPYFYELYLNGGIYLSIIKDDDAGAIDIYNRGLSYFPLDFKLLYNTGFHYYYELKDIPNAGSIYKKMLKHHGAKVPIVISTLLAKIEANDNNGSLEHAFEIIYEAWKKSPDASFQKKALFERLYSIRAELDLNCLNSNQINCSKKDLNGENYIFQNGFYSSKKEWKKFIKEKKK